MHSLAPETDVRAMNVVLDDARLVVDLMDGRTIAVPLAWYPRLANATPEQRNHWQLAGGGYGIHWPDIEANKKDTHFNCLNKQHSLNSCPWPAPVAPPSRWPTHLSETYADNFESGWISVLFL